MKKLVFTFFVAVLFSTLGGCSLWPYNEARRNIENSRNLRIGMTKTEVLDVMGEPEKNQRYNTPDRWFYYVKPEWHDFQVTEDECLPLIFENGRLIGWGTEFHARYLLRPMPTAPPTLATETEKKM